MATTTQIISITPEELSQIIGDAVKKEIIVLKEDLQSDTKSHPQYLSRQAVADFFGVSKVTIDSWSKKGRLTAYRIGNRIRYNKSEIENALKQIK